MEEIENLVRPLENILNRALDNIYLNTAIKVFIVLYAALAAPKLPGSIINLLDNTFTRIFISFMIVLIATKDPSIALLVSIAFIISLQTANKLRLVNTSLSVNQKNELSWLPSDKDSQESYKNKNKKKKIDEEMPPEEMPAEAPEEMPQEMPEEMPEEMPPEKFSDSLLRDEIDAMNLSVPSENLKNPVSALEEANSNKNASNPFTTQYQFLDAQSNLVPGQNQESSNKTFENQHCIQAMQEETPDGNE